MAGAGPAVGRVSVKVTPDVSGFAKKVEAEIQSQLDDLIVKIYAEWDKASSAKARAQAKADAESADATVKVKMQADKAAASKLAADIEQTVENIEAALDAVDVATRLDESGFMAGLARLQALTDGVDPTVRIDTRVDLGDATADLAKLSTALALIDQSVELDVITRGVLDAIGQVVYLRRISRDIDLRVNVDYSDVLGAITAFSVIDVDDFTVRFDVDGLETAVLQLEAFKATADILDGEVIDVQFDDENIAASAARIHAIGEALEADQVRIPVDFDIIAAGIARMAAHAARARAAAEAAAGPIRLRMELDNNSFRRVAAQLRSTAEGVANRVVMKVPLSVDGDPARRQVATLIHQIERDFSRLRISTSPALSRALTNNINSATRELQALEQQIDRNNRQGNVFTRSMSSMANGFGNLIGKIRLSGHSMLILLGVLALAAPALAIISGALITLPGLFAAAGVAGAAMALSWKGIKEASKVLEDEFKSLQTVMENAGKIEFTPVFLQLEHLFPVLERSLPGVTRGMSDLAMGFALAVTSEPGLRNIENTIQNVSKALSMAQPGVTDFTEGILNLVSKTSNRLPGLSKIFNKLGENFETWINKITTVDEKGTTPLDRALTQTKEIARGVAESIGNLFTKGFELLEEDKLGDKIRNFLKGFDTFVNETLPTMRDTFNTISDTISTIASVWSGIEWGIDPLEKLGERLEKDRTGKNMTDEQLKEEMPGPDFLKNLDVVRDAYLIGREIGARIKQAVKDSFLEGGWALDYANFLQSFDVSGLMDQILTQLGTGINPIEAIQKMFGWLQSADFTAIASRIADALSSAIMNALTLGAWGNVDIFNSMFDGVSFDSLVTKAGAAMSEIAGIVGSAIPGITAFFPGIGTSFSSVMGTLPGIGSSSMAETLSAILSSASGYASALFSAGQNLIQGLINGIKSMIGSAVSAAIDAGSQIISAAKSALGINSPSVIMHEIGEYVSEGLANGITAQASKPATAMTQMISSLDVDTESTLSSILSDVSDMTTKMVQGIEETHGTVNVTVNIGTINANQYEQVANQIDKSNQKIASSADKASKAQEKVYGKLDIDGKKASDGISTQIDEVELEIERLEAIYDGTKSKAAQADLEARIKSLEIRKKELEYQKKSAEYQNKYGESLESAIQATEAQSEAAENSGKTLMEKLAAGIQKGTDGVTDAVKSVIDAIGEEFNVEDLSGKWGEIWDDSEMATIGKTVVDENKSQFFSDLGAGGNGALSKAFEQVPQWIIQVNSVDEALTAKERETNKNTLKYSNR